MVGRGVDQTGIDSTTWSDHTDIRPTMVVLLGLNDDYSHDGHALTEDLGWARPSSVKEGGSFLPLAEMYKRLDATVGELRLASLKVSTTALESTAAGDSTYTKLENQSISITSRRDALASQMVALLEGASSTVR
jgi:hypothetical protein